MTDNISPNTEPTSRSLDRLVGARYFSPDEEGELPTFEILVKDSAGTERSLRQRIPGADATPSGWDAVQLITGISARTARAAWTSEMSWNENAVAESAAQRLHAVAQEVDLHVRSLEAGGVEIANPERIAEVLKGGSKVRSAKFDATCRCGARIKAGARIRLHGAAGILSCLRCETDMPEKKFEHGEVDDDVIYFQAYDSQLVDVTRTVLREKCPSMFVYGAVAGESSGTPALVQTIGGKAGITVLDDVARMRGTLVRYAKFRTLKGIVKEPPKALVEHLIKHPDSKLRTLAGLARIPMMSPEGRILQTPGWDENSKWWYAPEVAVDEIPDAPTDDDVAEAKRLILDDVFVDFPFVDESARAAAIACLMEQIVRPLIRGPRPLYASEAPAGAQGSGKTLLAKAVQMIIAGEVSIDVYPAEEDEMAKLITSLLLTNRHVIVFDNITRIVASTSLAALTTGETWSKRLLSTNSAPRLCNTPTWILTLNDGTFNRDLARRVVMISLDTKMTDAFRRGAQSFKHPDLLVWVKENRAKIIRACLVLARRWFADGKPKDPDLVMGSFESWCEVVGGILHHAGIKGLATAIEGAHARDVETQERERFVELWATKHGEQDVTPGQLGALAQEEGLFEPILRNQTGAWIGRRTSEDILPALVGRTFAGHRVEQRPQRSRHPYFALRRVQEVVAPAPSPIVDDLPIEGLQVYDDFDFDESDALN